jgi:NADH-quinone oxidoreductase subunit H
VVVGILLIVALIDPGGARHQRELEEAEQRKLAEAPSLDRIPWPPPPQAAGRGRPAVSAGASANGSSTVIPADPGPRQER